MIYNSIFEKTIVHWYSNNRTPDFPWQRNKTEYKIWLSEIMLQQTQVNTVIPYYQKFLATFPTIFQLAKAELNEILYLWSGLGYYKRAINLHKTAKIIVKYHAGKFPQDLNTLISFPGIGRSTAGAILSLALNQRYPILDGNIKRILIRYYSINYNTMTKSVLNNKLWFLMEKLIPHENIAIFNQAMMDLGRLICTYKNPSCNICPINKCCQFFLSKTTELNSTFKINIQKKSKRVIWWLLLLLKKNQTVWLIQRDQDNLWKGLFCFPEFCNLYMLNYWLLKHDLHHNTSQCNMTVLKQQISNIYLEINPILMNINKINNLVENNGIWYNLYKPAIIGLPKPVIIILEKLKFICTN